MRLEIVVADAIVGETIAIIAKKAKTGNIGYGRIFISPVEGALRIGTGQRGEETMS